MLVSRGLHTLPFLSREGFPVIYAVDSRSRFVAWRSIPPDACPATVKAELRAELDAADPPSSRSQSAA